MFDVKNELIKMGAILVGFGDISELPSQKRDGLPTGISVAVAYPKEIIRSISHLPTPEYHEWYIRLNEQLDTIVARGATLLHEMGYKAVPQTREKVGNGESSNNTVLPHKTIATRAGLGWIGKSALLVTREYGSAVRLSSILTDAPLVTASPINKSLCGDCMICKEACPGEAISGNVWEVSLYRDEFFDPIKCRKTAKERSLEGFGGEATICGKCIEICPHTRRYTHKKEEDYS